MSALSLAVISGTAEICRVIDGRWAQELIDGISDLAVTIISSSLPRGIDVRAFERGQRKHGTASNGRLVGGRGEDGWQPVLVADGAKRGNRSLTNEGVVMGLRELGESGGDRRIVWSLATRPCSLLDDANVVVVEQGCHGRAAARGRQFQRRHANERVKILQS